MKEGAPRTNSVLIDSAGAARILGVSRQEVVRLAMELEDFPSPASYADGVRFWDRSSMLMWASGHKIDPAQQDEVSVTRIDRQAGELDAVLNLAVLESKELVDGHVGLDHLVIAMARSDCPGLATAVLTSLGLRHGDLRHAYRQLTGEREANSATARRVTTAVLLALERAKLWAASLADDRVSSEHVLLAVGDKWGDSPLMEDLARRGIDRESLRQRVITVTEAAQAQAAHPASNLELAAGPDGRDPRERQPWSSIVVADELGKPIKRGKALIQYFVDRNGVPVRTKQGDLVHILFDDRGRIVFEAGKPQLVPVRLPPGHGSVLRAPE